MNIQSLISKHLNSTRKAILTTSVINNYLVVNYRVSIPKWVNDVDILKESYNGSVVYYYRFNNEMIKYLVDNNNINDVYPLNIKNYHKKILYMTKEYKIEELIDKDITKFFMIEYNDITKSAKAYISLNKIQRETNKWKSYTSNDVTSHYYENIDIYVPTQGYRIPKQNTYESLPF